MIMAMDLENFSEGHHQKHTTNLGMAHGLLYTGSVIET
jgi:hypothetical protein